MSKHKIKRAPAQPLRHSDGRLRGLVLAEADWRWLQFKPGDRVTIEFVSDDDETDIALGHDDGDYDIASGEVVIDDGQKLVRCHALDASDLRHKLFVRRPMR